jgi:hypothetical protein
LRDHLIFEVKSEPGKSHIGERPEPTSRILHLASCTSHLASLPEKSRLLNQSPGVNRFTGIGLIVCLTVPFLASWGWLHLEKEMVRHAVKESILRGLPENELVTLRFSVEESKTLLDWHHAGEFEYLGQMYDIISKQESVDSIVYNCWADNAETYLNKAIDDLTRNGNNTDSNRTQHKLTDFLKTLYHLPDQSSITLSLAHSLHLLWPLCEPQHHAGDPPPAPPPERA